MRSLFMRHFATLACLAVACIPSVMLWAACRSMDPLPGSWQGFVVMGPGAEILCLVQLAFALVYLVVVGLIWSQD